MAPRSKVHDNIFVGYQSGYNTTGHENVAIGESTASEISKFIVSEKELLDKHEDLRKLKDEYEDLLDKYRTFEILRR